MTKRIFHPFLILALSFFLVSCAEDQLQSNVSYEEFQELSSSVKVEKEEKQSQFWDQALPVTDDNEYILETGDLVSISVFGTEELSAEERINSRGLVTIPLLGRVELKGLTAAEAEGEIERLLSVNFMHEPHVTLLLKEMVGQQVTVVGSLNRPGTFEIKSNKTILDVIALAGGVAENAGNTAYVTRSAKNGEEGNKVFIVDLFQLISKGRVDMNMPVRGGDVIFVPESGVVSVDGAVRQPGAIHIDGEMTIDKAIAAAGGLAKYADLEDVKLIRTAESGERKIVQLSMMQIQGGNDQPILLQEDDVVYVEASGSKVFSTGFGFNLGFMGTGVSFDSPVK